MRSLFVLAALLLGCRDKTAAVPNAPVLAIAVEYPGANAEEIEASVVRHVEEAVGRVAGVKAIESHIETDHATVLLVFASTDALERGMHEARHELAVVQATLPRDVMPPILRRTRQDDRPIQWLAVRGTLPVTELSTHAHEAIIPTLERLPGVAAVEAHGFAEVTVIVRPDLERIAAAGLPMFDVLAALQSTEVGQVDALGDIVVKQVGEVPVHLRDVATIEQGFEREPGANEPMIAIRAQVAAEPSVVRRAVKDAVAKLELPPGMTVVEAKSPLPERPRATVTVSIFGDELDKLDALAAAYTAALKGMTIVRDPPAGEPEQTVVPDRDRAAQLGIPLTDIFATLRAVGSTRAGQVIVDGVRRPITVKLATSSLVEAFDKLFVKTHQGNLLPLSQVVAVKTGIARAIVRRDRRRAIILSIDGPTATIEKAIAAHPLPAGYRVEVKP